MRMMTALFQLIIDPAPVRASDAGIGIGAWIAIAIAALGIAAVVLRMLTRALFRPEMHGITPEKVRETWKQIEQTSSQGLMGAKLAVMEADKLLDAALKSMMMPGSTMAERLKTAQYKYRALEKVWWAHKLRNQLAHDAAFEITSRQAKQALKDFEAALKTLNIL